MKIVFLRGSCGSGRTCPNINLTDRDTYVVQGYVVADQQHSPTEAVVEIPLTLVPELSGRPLPEGLTAMGNDMLHIRGQRITDRNVLAELDLPVGEDAVEIPRALLPELVTVNA